MNKNYYEILGVDRNIDDKELKKVYRKLALQCHPDKMSGKTESEKKAAEEKFKEITEAYSVLSDADKRKMYDTYGTIDPNMVNSGFGSMDDIINAFMNESGGFGHFSKRQKIYKGDDKTIRIWLDLLELYKGGNKNVKYKVKRPCPDCQGKGSKTGKEQPCPHCNGNGYVVHTERNRYGFSQRTISCPYCNGNGYVMDNPCQKCKGSGLTEQEEQLSVTIPSVDLLNQTYVKKSAGHSCYRQKGENGDLYIQFGVRQDEKFSIDENNLSNLITEVEVPVIDCILGGEIKITNIDGKVLSFNLRQGTNNNEVYTIKDKGFPLSNGKRGSLCVIIKTIMPIKLDDSDKKPLQKLKKSNNFK